MSQQVYELAGPALLGQGWNLSCFALEKLVKGDTHFKKSLNCAYRWHSFKKTFSTLRIVSRFMCCHSVPDEITTVYYQGGESATSFFIGSKVICRSRFKDATFYLSQSLNKAEKKQEKAPNGYTLAFLPHYPVSASAQNFFLAFAIFLAFYSRPTFEKLFLFIHFFR